MKIMKPVLSADENPKVTLEQGTKFYVITNEMILENSPWANNCWFNWVLTNYTLDDILDLDYLDGSEVIDDDLYLCVTNYDPIFVGNEEVDPLDALNDFSLEQLRNEGLIDDNPSPEIIRKITDSEINWMAIDIDSTAQEMLNYDTLAKVAYDAIDLNLIEE